MATILGIDLGTQSVKAAITDTETGILASAGQEYPVLMPKPGYAQEDPGTWWASVLQVLAALRREQPKAFDAIGVIGLTGQMHGLVSLTDSMEPAYPAIIWLDQRSAAQVAFIYETQDPVYLAHHLQNRIFPGYALPSLLWLHNEVPNIYRKIAHIICPKDYIRLKLTGELGCEPTDASGTCLYDLSENAWFVPLLEALDLDPALLVRCGQPAAIAGAVTKSCSAETSLREGIPVIYGASDESALLLGNGLISEGKIVANIGTGATVSVFSSRDHYDPKLRTHTFCNAVDHSYAVFGAILGGGINMRWMRDSILEGLDYAGLSSLAAQAPCGSEGLIFLPYTSGERTPHMDPEATGMFFGLRLLHDRRYLVRAVMEGICFAMRDCLLILSELGLPCDGVIASGGGARSDVWMQIMADILDQEVRVSITPEQACLGISLLAAVAQGFYRDLQEGCDALVRLAPETYTPDPARAAHYKDQFAIFRELYTVNRLLMHRAAGRG